jgi:hypothetical protein
LVKDIFRRYPEMEITAIWGILDPLGEGLVKRFKVELEC